MPFGGTGSAGMGHYYGKYGFDALSHAKSILISPPEVAIEHLYSPFTNEKNQALKGGSNIEAQVHIGCLGGDVAELCGRENAIRPFRIGCRRSNVA